MHSYYKKLLPNHFDEYLIPISTIHFYLTRLYTSNNLFLPRVENVPCHLLVQMCGLAIPDCIKSSATFTFRWKLKKHFLHVKDT